MSKKKNENPVIKYLTAEVLALVIYLIISFVFAYIYTKTPYHKENTLPYSIISITVSSFVASFVFSFRERKNGLVSGLIIAAVFTVILFIIYAFVSSFKLNESSFLIIPACFAPACVAGIIAVNIKKK